MELLQLKYFQIVARNNHIAKSAEQLNVSQPAISLMISRLEDELGIKLFDRIGRRVILNENGDAFLSHVDKILTEEKNARLELQELNQKRINSLRIILTSPFLLDGIILPFLSENPEVRLKLYIGDNKQCLNYIRNGMVDFCISVPGIWANGIETKICAADEIVVAVSKEHRFADQDYVTMEEISKERIITLTESNPFRQYVDEVFASYGINIKYQIECTHEMRNYFLKANQGVALNLRSAEKRHLYGDGIRLIPIENNMSHTHITLSYLKDHYQTKVATQMQHRILSFYRQM